MTSTTATKLFVRAASLTAAGLALASTFAYCASASGDVNTAPGDVGTATIDVGTATDSHRRDSTSSPQRPSAAPSLPLVINTWEQNGFSQAAEAAWQELLESKDILQAVVAGGLRCQDLQCDGSVGYGGSPDERGETTLDAAIMDGPTHVVGAVADLRRVKNAIGVAWAVMNYSKHTLLVGESATQFAMEMGFQTTNLTTDNSEKIWHDWRAKDCQPNYRRNVVPEPRTHCGPYKPQRSLHPPPPHSHSDATSPRLFDSAAPTKTDSDVGQSAAPVLNAEPRPPITPWNHDTLGLIVVNATADIAAGVTTNGASHKIPGRVGDSPIPGSGYYVDNDVGAAAGTGDGDILMRFLPAYQAVENMRNGMTPEVAAQKALARITHYYQNFVGALVVANKKGDYGAACHGLAKFPYSVRTAEPDHVQILYVDCI